MRDRTPSAWSAAKAEALEQARFHGEDYRIIKKKAVSYDAADRTAGQYVVVSQSWVDEFKSKPQQPPILFSVMPFIAFASNGEGENHVPSKVSARKG